MKNRSALRMISRLALAGTLVAPAVSSGLELSGADVNASLSGLAPAGEELSATVELELEVAPRHAGWVIERGLLIGKAPPQDQLASGRHTEETTDAVIATLRVQHDETGPGCLCPRSAQWILGIKVKLLSLVAQNHLNGEALKRHANLGAGELVSIPQRDVLAASETEKGFPQSLQQG